MLVGGVVQGVGFRYFAKREADRLHLTGFVRNRADGRVELEVEGDEKALRDYVGTVRAGPRWGHVSEFHVQDVEPTFSGSHFEIKF